MHNLDQKSLTGIAALLVHAAKIDEQYSDHEKKIIKEFIQLNSKKNNVKEILEEAEQVEKDSNQLLNFTNILKKNTNEIKSNIIEQLWKIIISDNNVDQYESNLMRRICGLIYFSDKISAEIKMKLLNNK